MRGQASSSLGLTPSVCSDSGLFPTFQPANRASDEDASPVYPELRRERASRAEGPLLPAFKRSFDVSPFLSVDCALFSPMGPSQLLSHQSLPHSFPCNGEWVAASLASGDSASFLLRPTANGKRSTSCAPLTSLECAVPRFRPAKSFRMRRCKNAPP